MNPLLNRSVVEVDLTTGSVSRWVPDPELLRLVLGGRGLGAALIARWLLESGENGFEVAPVILTPGLLTGSPWPAAARYHVTFRSPLTGVYGYANAGGSFGTLLAGCGVAALVVRGVSEKPVCLVVHPDCVEIRSAEALWGRTTGETEDCLISEFPGASVVSIGPAGENRVLYASLMNDGGRAAGRCGGGAVWGAKRLKAVVALPAENNDLSKSFLAVAVQASRKVRSCPVSQVLSRWGTPFLVSIKNEVGDLPTKNRRMVQFPFADRVDAHALEPYRIARKGCRGCPIVCGRVSEVSGGAYAGRTAGPEYETIDALGPLCYCSDPEAIIHANLLCNELGMDTISTGNVIAFAMECSEHGMLDRAWNRLDWGDGRAITSLITEIAHRRGLGGLLANGVQRAAEAIGSEARCFAMEVKGMEVPCQDPRVAKGFGLAHATSNRGADHLYALPTMDTAHLDQAGSDLLPHAMPELLDPDDVTYKPDMVKFSEEYCAVSDALGICKFTTTESYALYPEDVAQGLNTLGVGLDAGALLEIGERLVNLERLINTRLGLSGSDDRLPDRFTDEAVVLESGETKSLPLAVFSGMLARYYRLRGWTPNGIPRNETARRLGVDKVIVR